MTELGPSDERGATSVEYALLMTLIAVAILVSVGLFGDAVRGLFANVQF
ncbi:Flp family type IVb pilin [Nocardioides sp. W3-2-3]|nr:Flp family type IVb pilin [Nocardioides convexus]NHA00019.1 Flp family type IVb pilin [Nocardioides convexus]